MWPLLAALALSGCDKVPLLAPTNTTIRLIVGLGVLPIAGSTEITAIVIESAGTPVQNGTAVTFTSTLGTVEPREARTTNGQVTVRYVAGSQSGTAKIGAFSGGSKSDLVDILVGAAAAGAVALRASTPFVPSTGGTADVIATVVDTGGNALRGAPVRFTTTFGELSQTSVLTNDAGEARSQLTTNVTAEVTARVGTGATAPEGKVTITARDLPSLAIEVSSPLGGNATTTEVGLPVSLKLTPSANSGIRSAVVDFGDGIVTRLGPVATATTLTHTYNRTGSYTVTVTATDALGFSGTSSVIVTVTDRGTVPLQLTVQSNSALIVSFNASVQGSFTGTIRTYDWDFGDRTGTTTTGPTTSHRYLAAGVYVIRVSVVTTTGQQGFTEITIRVA